MSKPVARAVDAAAERPAPLPFSIAFDPRDEEELLGLWRDILRSNRWSDGAHTRAFEAAWADETGLKAVAFNNWAGGALAALDFVGVSGETVLSPSNTFLATPRSALVRSPSR